MSQIKNQSALGGYIAPTGASLCEGAAARQTHITEEMELLTHTVNELSSAVGALLARLSDVTAPLPVEANADGEPDPDTYRVPLADNIRALRRRLQGIERTIINANQALEL